MKTPWSVVGLGLGIGLSASVTALAAGGGGAIVGFNLGDQSTARAALIRRSDLPRPSPGWEGSSGNSRRLILLRSTVRAFTRSAPIS